MSTLKGIREALCVAQTALTQMAHETPSHEIGTHQGVIDAMIAQIDLHRPVGPDGVHGDLHTPTCGCEDAPTVTKLMAGGAELFCAPTDWTRHELDTTVYATAGLTGPPWPKWAGSEPIDPPDPQCVCSAPWDSDNDRCPLEAALRDQVLAEVFERDAPLLAAVEDAVQSIRGQRGLSSEALTLIQTFDARKACQPVTDLLKKAWKNTRRRRSAFGQLADTLLEDIASDVHPQMVTRTMIYMLVANSGLYGTYLDGEMAHRIAQGLGVAVVEVPITIDYGPEKA